MGNYVVRVVRWTECLLGLLFIATAALKALDLEGFAWQVSYYGVIREPSLVRFVAFSTTAFETLLGVALLLGLRIRGWTHVFTFGLLLGFSALIGYAWAFRGLADCGCFGTYLPMTPGPSILKNVAMMALIAWAWLVYRRHAGEFAGRSLSASYPYAKLGAGALSIGLVVVAGFYGWPPPDNDAPDTGTTPDKDRPFAQFRFEVDGETWDLGEGEYLVAMLSDSCDHCVESVETLNELASVPELPQVIGLMLGEEETLQEFLEITNPQFPTLLIEALTFFQFIGVEPPRFIHVRDGKQVRFWDEDVPEDLELLEEG